MTKFLALVRINLLDLLLSTFGRKAGDKHNKKQTSGWVMLLILAGLMLYTSGTYSYLLAQVLAPLGKLENLLALMLFFGVLFCTTFTLYLAQSLLFSQKDDGQVFTFPVSALHILLSRLCALYLEVLFILEVFLLPTGVVYLLFINRFDLLFLLFLFLIGAFFSFVPTFISLIFGLLNSLILAKTPFKHFFTILCGLCVPLVILSISFMFSFSSTSSASILALSEQLRTFLPPLSWATAACVQGNFLLLFLIALVCILPFFLLCLLVGRFYQQILTALQNKHKRTNFKLQAMPHQSSFKALFLKEAKRFFTTPSYFLNSSFALILLLFIAIFSFFFPEQTLGIYFSAIQSFAHTDMVASSSVSAIILLSLLSFISATFQPSAVSLSLEGKTLWILKSSPLPIEKIFLAKAGFPYVCISICLLFSVPLLGNFLSLSIWQIVGILLVLLASCAFSSLFGLILNLKYPRLDALNDVTVVKQSLSVILGLLFGILQAFLIVAVYALSLFLDMGVLCFLPGFLLALAACAYAYIWLKKHGSTLFLELN